MNTSYSVKIIVIPALSPVIPAKAGIHHDSGSPPSGDSHRQQHQSLFPIPASQRFANAMDSRLRGNDEVVRGNDEVGQLPSIEEIEQELGGGLEFGGDV